MAPATRQMAVAANNESPYKLDSAQVSKASKALTKQLDKGKKESEKASSKKDLLAGDDDEEQEVDTEEGEPIFITVNTKRHILDQNRLKPSAIKIPHSLHANSPSLRICLITADPPTSTPKAYKDLVRTDTSFPSALAAKVKKIIAVSKLRAKYKSYESLRQLNAEFDLFLADDRIIKLLPQILGNKFYKTTAKRPVPVVLSRPQTAAEGKAQSKEKVTPIGGKPKNKVAETGGPESIGSATQVRAAIEAALSSAYVHLSQASSTNVKVSLSSFPPEHTAANVEAVVNELIERLIPQKWKNVSSIYLKGARTVGLPLWLADQLWLDDGDVKEGHADAEPAVVKGAKGKKALEGGPVEAPVPQEKKRKAAEAGDEVKGKKAKKEKGSAGARKDQLKKLKAQAVAEASA